MATDFANALYTLSKGTNGVSFYLGALPVALDHVAGRGGLKRVYSLPDGKAIAVPNVDSLHFKSSEEAETHAALWERATAEEKTMADKFRAVGLEAQQIELQTLSVGGHPLPVLVMPSFAALAEQGLQVRDVKNETSSCGHSMLFGTINNLHSVDRLRLVMQGLADDTTTILSHGLPLMSGDGFNIAIQDSQSTPPHNKAEVGLFDERNQRIRGFFFDFASKSGPRLDKKPSLLNARGEPDVSSIREHVTAALKDAYHAIRASITDEEIANIYGLDIVKDYAEIAINKRDKTCDILDANFTAINAELIEAVTRKTFKTIDAMPPAQRLSKFSGPDRSAAGQYSERLAQGSSSDTLPPH